MERRKFLGLAAGAVVVPRVMFGGVAAPSGYVLSGFSLSKEDEALLDDLQRRGCLYFVEQAGAKTGQVLDRAAAANTTGKIDPRPMASIAATGFGLSALCIAEKRGYMPRAQVVAQVRRTLKYHLEQMPHEHGFLYHFNDVETGGSYGGVEVSSIDTALLLCGVLTARAHFHADVEIVKYATALYERADWQWMLNGGTALAMGWRKGEFLQGRWSHYCELMMMYLLGLGSPTHPLPAESWDAFTRPKMKFEEYEYISAADPLFVHQYSHAWYDFRGKRDAYADYFDNSVTATKAHKAWCESLGKPYSEEYWGVSASDSAEGYTAWGGPPMQGKVDGSVVPYAPAGSLPFMPEDCLRVLRSLKTKYGAKAYGRYGFCDAFHPDKDWYDPDVLGIDLGIGVLMAENLRTGFVWETFGRNPEVAVAMKRAKFKRA